MLNSAQLARLDLNLLLVFDLLFEERNAGRAAARLHLSPSAISHALRRLRTMLNDPLFLPTSKGMVPTERAEALAPAIRDIIERVHGVIASAEEFDPGTAVRRFRIGAPDGAISSLVPTLVKQLETVAPGICVSVVQLLPSPGSTSPDHAWQGALSDLHSRLIDLAILPHRPSQSRFYVESLFSEHFVILCRNGHPFASDPSLKAFTSARHVLVSSTGDASGIVDELLASRGLDRQIALTVPNFFMAAAAIAASDLIGALPSRFAAEATKTFPVQVLAPPVPIQSTDLHVVVPKTAMLDQGLAWLVRLLTEKDALVTGRRC
ncbi:LysR family transcriptional regulator [Sphingomonas mesophila]|uniref:LysR family transcriptional regulator n=1 Tax=Sphingomonas mesophila TaxID=2303576 RepID=UPI000E5815D2|nr:LysR family transcriptional regulator [Sphingomonas mesophila]